MAEKKFSNLRRAINGNTSGAFALAADGRGSTGTETKASDFIGTPVGTGVGGITSNYYITAVPVILTVQFSSQGSLFITRIKTRADNFGNWTSSNTDSFPLNAADEDYTNSSEASDLGTYRVSTSFLDYYNTESSIAIWSDLAFS